MTTKNHHSMKSVFIISFSMLIIILSMFPVFAETVPLQLTKSNVAELPTASGEMYYSQKINDYITLSGGKVTTDGSVDGTVISGEWTFTDPDARPNVGDDSYTSITFTPDDQNAYIGFSMESIDVNFHVKRSPMEFVDSNVQLTTEKNITKGARLASVKIKAVALRCPLTGEEITTAKFAWKQTGTTVSQSGYFPATIKATGFETIDPVYVYVRVNNDDSLPPISEFPSVDPVTYFDGMKTKDIELKGGKGTVDGHFEFSDKNQELRAGNNIVDVVFIPDDTEQKQINVSIIVKVEKAVASFVDENGTTTVPKLTWTLGTKYYLTNLFSQLEKMKANCGTFKVGAITIDGIQPDGNIFVANEYKVDGYTATATLKSQDNTNYTNTLKFKIIIEKNKINPDIQSQGNNMFAVVDRNIFSSATLAGSFTVEAQGEKGEYAQTITDVKLNVPFEYHPGKSGNYTFTITYDDKNDEKYELPEPVEVSKDIVLSWTVTGKNVHFDSRLANYGEEVMVDATITNDKFGGWKFYDESGKEIKDFNYTETSQNLRITFVMPDYPITVEAVDKTQSGISGGGNFSDFFSNFVKWLNNLAAKLKALFDAIAQLLTVVG